MLKMEANNVRRNWREPRNVKLNSAQLTATCRVGVHGALVLKHVDPRPSSCGDARSFKNPNITVSLVHHEKKNDSATFQSAQTQRQWTNLLKKCRLIHHTTENKSVICGRDIHVFFVHVNILITARWIDIANISFHSCTAIISYVLNESESVTFCCNANEKGHGITFSRTSIR